MLPDDFWVLTPGELADMVEAVVDDEHRRDEDRYFLAAWTTAHLMNATGHYKKPVTPNKLLGKAGSNPSGTRFESKEAKLAALAALKQKFQQ